MRGQAEDCSAGAEENIELQLPPLKEAIFTPQESWFLTPSKAAVQPTVFLFLFD